MAAANVTNTSVVPTETTLSPYYDDFNESKNFHRILFRPGYPVQARELTQSQTILQNQVERFGRHIFTNGSSVVGGEVFIPPGSSVSINLNPEYASTSIDLGSFLNKTVTDGTAEFIVSAVTVATETDPPVIYGNYMTEETFGDSTTINVKDESTYAITASANSSSISKLAYIRDSIFFMNGYFVKVPKQTAVVGKYTGAPTCQVGLEFTDAIITESSDSSLLDPALEASNYQAPGASRYRVDMVLSSRDLSFNDQSKFIELVRLENGVITKNIQFPVYSEIEEVMARRTYDESGNYTVSPFTLNLVEDKYDPLTNFGITLSPGKAYIYGYEFQTIGDTYISAPKARVSESISSYQMNINYGNYVIVDNLNGDFGTQAMNLFDIHCANVSSINRTSNTTYQQTKIGTGRARAFDFYSGDVDLNARKYEFYLFDTNYRSITTNGSAFTANTITLTSLNNQLSNTSNIYDNAILTITSGDGSGPGGERSFKIESYNAVSRVVTFSQDFFVQPTVTSNLSIQFDFSDAESFIIDKRYTPGATTNANCNITTLSKSDGTVLGDAVITESSLNSLLFQLPQSYIANNITNVSYFYKRKFDPVQFNSGKSDVIQASTNEDFQGGSSTSNISSTVMQNFFIVCTDKKSSGRANGDIIKANVSISGTPEQAVFNTGNSSPNDSFVASIYATMEYNTGVLPKVKTFVESNSQTLSDETPVYLTSPTGSSANVYLNAGQVIISNPSKVIGASESLYISDVIGVQKIYDLNGADIPAAGDDISNLNDISERYELYSGQTLTHYDHATIKLKPNWPAPKGPIIVCCLYYAHTKIANEGNYFSIDSYPHQGEYVYNEGTLLGDGYALIPSHYESSGKGYALGDCIDFRPARQNATNTSPNYTLTNVSVPINTTDFKLDYSYYLGRKDIIVLNANKTIEHIQGTPSLIPIEPTIPNRTMVLYTLTVPPYTERPTSVSVKYIDNRRYTMRDIGKIDKRVENLEYYVSLNSLEKNSLDMTIPDVNGLDRTKYGIFVDSFTGHSLGSSYLPDYKCAMDFQRGVLQPEATTTGIQLSANVSSGDVTIHRDKVTLNYSEIIFASQPFATKAVPISEFLYASFDGNIVTLPEADIWKSTNADPDIIITDTNTIEHTTLNVFQTTINSQTRA